MDLSGCDEGDEGRSAADADAHSVGGGGSVIADEALAIQQWLTQSELPREPLIDGMLKAFAGDPDHRCMGRSAPARLERAIHQAATANLNVPTLKKVAASTC